MHKSIVVYPDLIEVVKSVAEALSVFVLDGSGCSPVTLEKYVRILKTEAIRAENRK